MVDAVSNNVICYVLAKGRGEVLVTVWTNENSKSLQIWILIKIMLL